MKNKKIFILLILVLITILIAIYYIINNFQKNQDTTNNLYSDYTPEEEISSKQMRETIVNLYFLDKENKLKSEGKLIDSNLLISNPYMQIIELLLNGPSNTEQLKNSFPENTKIIDATIKNTCVTLNFSNELLNYENEEQKLNIINCILNTLCELNEVNSFKILINNETVNKFNEIYSL